MAQRRRAPVQESLDIALPRPAETEVEAYGFIRKEVYIVFKVLYLFSPFAQSTSHILNCKLPVEMRT